MADLLVEVDIESKEQSNDSERSGIDSYKILEPENDLGSPMKDGSLRQRVERILEEYEDHLMDRRSHHLGYPYNLDFDFSQLETIHKFSVNNLGDPFVASNYGIHSRKFEIGVLEWFASLWEIEKEDMWGYITNCGTEGNLHGILTGREVLPNGILYCSRATHYSVPKASHMYRMELCFVDVFDDDAIDCEHLKKCLLEGKKLGKPAIINVNIGTTVTGAVDSLRDVIRVLNEAGYQREDYYIHVDGALFGMMMPFIKEEEDADANDMPLRLTFKHPIDSVSVSGHKFIGAPVPCGVIITRREHIAKLSKDIEYLNSKDTTIMGSRNGHAALYLWYAIQMKGIAGFRADTLDCINKAKKLKAMLTEAGVKAHLGGTSSTVVFERPTNIEFVRKWQLACQGEVAHVVVMPSVSMDTLATFVSELKRMRSA